MIDGLDPKWCRETTTEILKQNAEILKYFAPPMMITGDQDLSKMLVGKIGSIRLDEKDAPS